MKSLFIILVILIASFINNVESLAEVLNGCQLKPRNLLYCRDFQQTYLPYSEEFTNSTSVKVYGNYSELRIDPAYAKLKEIFIYSTGLQKFEFEKYANFKKLEGIYVYNSEQVVDIDFIGAEKFTHLTTLVFNSNKMLNYSCESLKSSNLKDLAFRNCNLKTFDISCLPSTIESLFLNGNKISTLNLPVNSNSTSSNVGNSSTTESYCSLMKNLTSLKDLFFNENRLEDFRFECLPKTILNVYLQKNKITEVPDLSKLPHSHQVAVDITRNPIKCTCSLFRDYVQLLDSNNVKFHPIITFMELWPAIKCTRDSEVSGYPWSNDAKANKLHDSTARDCLKTGEKRSNDYEYYDSNDYKYYDSNNNTVTDDNGNSGSINLIDVFLIIISHIISSCFMLF